MTSARQRAWLAMAGGEKIIHDNQATLAAYYNSKNNIGSFSTKHKRQRDNLLEDFASLLCALAFVVSRNAGGGRANKNRDKDRHLIKF